MNEQKTQAIVKKSVVADIVPADYGMDDNTAAQLKAVFMPMLDKMEELEIEFNEVVKKPITPEVSAEAKILLNKYVKTRTGTAKLHKDEKLLYLVKGRAVDGWKNAQLLAGNAKEAILETIVKHYENIEKARIAELDEARKNSLIKLGCEVFPADLGNMQAEVWAHYIKGISDAKTRQEAAEKKAELDRIEAERKAEADRLEKEEADKKERKRINDENETLKAEADAKRIKYEADEKERLRVAKIETGKQAAKDAEHAKELKKLEEEKLALKKKAEADQSAKDEEQARSKDKAHRSKIKNAAYAEIAKLTTPEAAKLITAAIISGKIPNVKITY